VRGDGRWPTEDQFVNDTNRLLGQHALSELDTYVQVLPLRPKVLRLYSDLTSVIRQLVPSVDLSTFDFFQFTLSTVPVPRVGLDIGTKTVYFPHIPAAGMREVARTIPKSRKSHPVTSFIDSVPEHIALDHLDYFVDCRRYMLPVVHDVMLRMLYRGLATRSKFCFLQDSDPTVVCCEVPGCYGVEICCIGVLGCKRCGTSCYRCGVDLFIAAMSVGVI